MPFPSYANTRPEDVAAPSSHISNMEWPLEAATPNITNDIVFPLSMRWPLTFWRLLFAKPKPTPFEAQGQSDIQSIARGAYFVEGLGHWWECHTPRNLVLQVKAQTPSQGSAFLSGAVIENYFAPSLRNGGSDTLGGWSENDIADFLTSGANPHGIVFGSMTDVIVHSTQYMSREDAVATARYLKTLSAPAGQPTKSFAYDETEHQALRHGDLLCPALSSFLSRQLRRLSSSRRHGIRPRLSRIGRQSCCRSRKSRFVDFDRARRLADATHRANAGTIRDARLRLATERSGCCGFGQFHPQQLGQFGVRSERRRCSRCPQGRRTVRRALRHVSARD